MERTRNHRRFDRKEETEKRHIAPLVLAAIISAAGSIGSSALSGRGGSQIVPGGTPQYADPVQNSGSKIPFQMMNPYDKQNSMLQAHQAERDTESDAPQANPMMMMAEEMKKKGK